MELVLDLSDIEIKYCPECGSPLRICNGDKSKFWGCTNYPECNHYEFIEWHHAFEHRPSHDSQDEQYRELKTWKASLNPRKLSYNEEVAISNKKFLQENPWYTRMLNYYDD